MRILHTSDWHLGRALYSKTDRKEEHIAFLEWLLDTIKNESIDVLLVAGDIFDTATPGSTSQKLYYDFLIKVIQTGCKDIVIVGGNHDSPSLLNAPKEILSALKITIVGNACENIEDQIVLINDKNEEPVLIVCAVPFLRERDICRFVEGQSYEDRSKRINQGIQKHYEDIAEFAESKRKQIARDIPIIATGHLSVAGGKRNDDDGVREAYIGNIEAVGGDIFPDLFEYVALGHYHIPSVIKDHIRYCGSPIPMGFGEAGHQKCVYVIDFTNGKNISTIHIPVFQKLKSIIGNKDFIYEQLQQLKVSHDSVWVEIIYNGEDIFSDLSEWAKEQVNNSGIEILKIQNRQFLTEGLTHADTDAKLETLKPVDVFNKLMDKTNVSEDQKSILKEMYQEILDITQLNKE
ncbi:MAG: exonuclease SbcCD subunit D C-terminal domain-containing protein [Bacteroidetes bacterium]|nr:exonuclease SbcCD subunit D C-terminal domain-containing protein [Bacteroidota bacterium]